MIAKPKNNFLYRKLFFFIFLFLFFSLIPTASQAATKYWIGTSGGNFSADTNWSTTTGGANDTTHPVSGDTAIFDGGDVDNATIDVDSTVTTFQIDAGYSGTITVATGVTLTTGNFTQADGTFNAGDTIIDINGSTTISGGTFNMQSSVFEPYNNFVFSGGTFDGGTGTMIFQYSYADLTISGGTFTFPTGTTTITDDLTIGAGATVYENGTNLIMTFITSAVLNVPTTFTFTNLTIAGGSGQRLAIYTGDTVIVSSTLTLIDGELDGTGVLEFTGPGSGFSLATTFDGGSSASSGQLKISGVETRNIILDANVKLPLLRLDAVNTTIEFSGVASTTFEGYLYLDAGTINASSTDISFKSIIMTGGTFDAQNSNYLDINGSTTISGGIFSLQSALMESYNTLTVSGGTFDGGTGNLTIQYTYANLTISGGTFTFPTGTTTLKRNLTIGATATVYENGTTLYYTHSISATIDVPTTFTFTNFIIDGSTNQTVSMASGDTLVVSSTLNLVDGALDGSGTFEFIGPGSGFSMATTFDGGTGLLKITGTDTRNIIIPADVDMPKFTLNATNTTIEFSGVASTTFESTLNLEAGTINASSTDIVFNGAFTMTGGTFDAQNSNYLDFNSYAINISGGTFNMQSALMESYRALIVSGGTFDGGTGDLSITYIYEGLFITGGTFTFPTGTTSLVYNLTIGAGATVYENGTTLYYTHSTSATIDVPTTFTFTNLTIEGDSGQTVTIASGDTLVVSSTLNLIDGRMPGNILEFTGTNFSMASTFDNLDVATFNLTGTQDQTIDLTGVEDKINSDININKSSGTVTLNSGLTMDYANTDLNIIEGTLDLNGNTLIVNGSSGTVVVQDGGILKMQGGETVTTNATYPSFSSGSSAIFYGASSYTLPSFSTFYDVSFTGGGTYTFNTSTVATSTMTISSGTVALNGNNLTVSSTFSNDGTLRIQGGETVTLTNDTDSGTVEYVGNGDASSDAYSTSIVDFYDISINFTDSGDSLAPSVATTNINNDITLASGIYSATGTLNITGDFLNTGGTLTPNSSTVDFVGASQTISGANTFYNLTKTDSSANTFTLPASTTTTVNGTLTLAGTSGNLLSLRSSSSGTQTKFDPKSTTSAQYLDVKDNNNLSSTQIVCTTGCSDSGNNTRWQFDYEINFSATTASGDEGTTAVSVLISSDQSVVSDVSVDYAITGGTATGSGTDYTLSSGTASITNGNTTTSLSLVVVDDDLVENDETLIITISNPVGGSLGSTTTYTYTITNNDTAGVTISLSSVSVTEGSTTDTYTAVLDAQPTDDVTVSAALSNSEVSLSSSDLTFTNANWDTEQTVTVTATDDSEVDGETTTIISNTSASSDSNFDSLTIASVTATITDDDVASTGGGFFAPPPTPSKTPATESVSSGLLFTEFFLQEEKSAEVGASFHSVFVSRIAKESITVTIESDPIILNLIKGVSQKVDTNKDGVLDLEIEYAEFLNYDSVKINLINLTDESEISNPVVINYGAYTTESRDVTITFNILDADRMAVSNSKDFAGSVFTPFTSKLNWKLPSGNGEKTVYSKFLSSGGTASTYFDTILLNELNTETETDTQTEKQGSDCSLKEGGVYKTPNSSAVYLVTPDCKKRAFSRADVFYTYFDSWNNVEIVEEKRLETVEDDTLGFMPWGPKYDPKYGALVKITTDPMVYLLLGNQKYWIDSEEVFNKLNYSWNWIEDIDPRLLNKYTIGEIIDYTNRHPNYTLVKYENNPEVFRLEPDLTDQTKQVKRHIKNEEAFSRLNFRWDRIVTIKNDEEYEIGKELK
ncbi:MAG: hypothetical protein L3J07_02505 [Candidatus Magasanikbacteria bacterium]|nr:hypothetical protein [Candidatus Magasanikbacteria bacterium]